MAQHSKTVVVGTLSNMDTAKPSKTTRIVLPSSFRSYLNWRICYGRVEFHVHIN